MRRGVIQKEKDLPTSTPHLEIKFLDIVIENGRLHPGRTISIVIDGQGILVDAAERSGISELVNKQWEEFIITSCIAREQDRNSVFSLFFCQKADYLLMIYLAPYANTIQ